MKKINYLGMMMAAAAITACTSEDLVNSVGNDTDSKAQDNVMRFSVSKKNMTRATNMQDLGIYSFGVWAIKTSNTSDKQDVMEDYLVGYYDEANSKGYYGGQATTIGDVPASQDGYSMWFYEGLGSAEYPGVTLPTSGGFMPSSTSVNDKQYLKYWDVNSDYTEFWAYSPYDLANETNDDTSNSKKVTFDKNTGKLTVGTLWAGFNYPEKNEYLLAYNKVANTDYKKDVQLEFKRINAKVRLAFYETIAGYKVQINSVSLTNAHKNTSGEVQESDDDKITVGGTYSITALNSTASLAINVDKTKQAHFANLGTDNSNPFHPAFGVPEQIAVAANTDPYHTAAYKHITEDRTEAVVDNSSSMCPHTYYALPADNTNENSGFNVYVNFTLYSEDTNETLTIDGKVFVDSKYTQWVSNTNYVYVFRLTRDAEGLYPIVFDGIKVEDYDEADQNKYDWVINAENNPTDQVAITHNLPAEISGSKEFTVTCCESPANKVTGYVKALIEIYCSSSVSEKISKLEYEETNSVNGLGWKEMTANGKEYTFGGDSGFPLSDGTPLNLRLTPASGLTTGAEIKATIKIVSATNTSTVLGECTVTTKIK